MPRSRAHAVLAVVVALHAVALACLVATDVHFARVHRPDLQGLNKPEIDVLVLGLLCAAAVGVAVVRRQPRNPVGWAFLSLSGSMLVGFLIDTYAQLAIELYPGSLPGAEVSAVLSDSDWIPWFLALAWILYVTPTGTHLSPRWRLAARVTTGAGVSCLLLGLVSHEVLSPPYDEVDNPLVVDAIAAPGRWLGMASAIVMGLGLIAAAASVVVRFRRSRGDERRQLLWLVTALVPLPLFVLAAFVGSHYENQPVTITATAGFVTLVPLAAGLSVLRYRLYDVERVLSTTTTYTLLTLALVGTYGLVVWGGAHVGAGRGPAPEVSATVGALAAAVVASPLRRGIQDLVDRRFDRRSHEARRLVAVALAREDAGIDLRALLAQALRDDSLTISYPAGDGWVAPDGGVAPERASQVDVRRHGRLVARIGFDPDRTGSATVLGAARLASAELDNGRLRAELERKVEEIDESRRRLTQAQRRERRRIERDLHDGAQQSLLALAFRLQSAHLNGTEDRMRAALAEGAVAARNAVRELRALANGLHPAVLADGGLSAALEDMARSSPVPLHVSVDPDRLDPALEFTAWFVVGEAVANAQKHAGADRISVSVAREGDRLVLRVRDDGRGGANPEGPGLRGMRDRVDTAHGTLAVVSSGTGTLVEAVLPCGS